MSSEGIEREKVSDAKKRITVDSNKQKEWIFL